MSTTQINVPAPGQTGVQLAELPPPSFANYPFEGSTFAVAAGSNRADIENTSAQVATYGFANTHLVLTGNLNIRAGHNALRQGDTLKAKDTAPSTWAGRWLVVADIRVTRTLKGQPCTQEVELHYRPAMQTEFESNPPVDSDAASSS